MKEKHRRV